MKFNTLDQLLDFFTRPYDAQAEAREKALEKVKIDRANQLEHSWTDPNGGPPPLNPEGDQYEFLETKYDWNNRTQEGKIILIKQGLPVPMLGVKHLTWTEELVDAYLDTLIIKVKYWTW